MKHADGQKRGLQHLTYREKEVANLRAKGYSCNQIAILLTIEQNTVKTHLKNIYRKLGVSSQIELIQFAQNAKKARYSSK